jgi:hypothetical protein
MMAANETNLVAEIGGGFFDADRWIPGVPAGARRPGRGRGPTLHAPPSGQATASPSAIARAVARWHLAAEPMLQHPSPPEAPARAIFDAILANWRIDRGRLRPLTAEQPWAKRWLRDSEQVFDRAEHALQSTSFLVSAPAVIAHLAIWPGHLLVQDGEIRCILDPSHAAKSTPLMDIAAAITHTGRWSGEAAEEALGGYSEVRRLTPDERRMLPVIAAVDLVAESGRLLWTAFGPDARSDSETAARARAGAEVMIASLEAVTPAVGRAGEAVSAPKRRWEHRPHRGGGARPSATPRKP